MSLAFLYAGQGSQHPGMGADLYEAHPAFRAVLDAAGVDFDLKTTMFTDPDGVLNLTEYTQPCMVAFAAGMTALLAERGIVPDYAAGLSLGEYSALQCAGVFTAPQAISLAAFRGKAMAAAAAGRPCGMTAVLGLDREKLQEACRQAAGAGVVEIANYNCPGQLVIGGEQAAVDQAAALAKELGAKRCLPLKVSGPFHTSLLAPAGDALREKFKETAFGAMRIPVLFNWAGRWGRRTPSPPCWRSRCRPPSTWRTPSAAWPSWGWTPSWRSARARPSSALSRRLLPPSRPTPWRPAPIWTPSPPR